MTTSSCDGLLRASCAGRELRATCEESKLRCHASQLGVAAESPLAGSSGAELRTALLVQEWREGAPTDFDARIRLARAPPAASSAGPA